MRLLTLLFVSAVAVAATDVPSPDRPILSELGRKKAAENLGTIAANLKNLQESLVIVQKNVKTLAEEVDELDRLEREHLDLKRKFESYLGVARRELTRNDQEMRRINSTGAKGAAPKDKAQIEAERKQRETWREDAQPKIARVEKLFGDLMKNLSDIQSRRAPLKAQLATWSEREREYERIIRDHQNRKADLERLTAK